LEKKKLGKKGNLEKGKLGKKGNLEKQEVWKLRNHRKPLNIRSIEYSCTTVPTNKQREPTQPSICRNDGNDDRQ
jgi:hypothetical protein